MLVCVKERPGLSPRSTESRHRDAHPVLGLLSQLIANLRIVGEGRETQTFAHAVRSLFGSHGYTCSFRWPGLTTLAGAMGFQKTTMRFVHYSPSSELIPILRLSDLRLPNRGGRLT